MIEEAASKCYNSKPTNGAVTKKCYESGHTSVLEHASFTFNVSGVSRVLLAQLTRHRIGISPTVRSQRYCDERNSGIVIPPSISKNKDALEEFLDTSQYVFESYKSICDRYGIPQEDARYILPGGVNTNITITLNLRAFIHLCNERLCVRSQWEIRELVSKMRDLAVEVEDKIESFLVSKCEAHNLKFCPEEKSCGRYPTEKEIMNIYKNSL